MTTTIMIIMLPPGLVETINNACFRQLKRHCVSQDFAHHSYGTFFSVFLRLSGRYVSATAQCYGASPHHHGRYNGRPVGVEGSSDDCGARQRAIAVDDCHFW